MVNKVNEMRDSTNIRIKLTTKKKLESEAFEFGETHSDIIERLLKKDSIDKNTKKAKYVDKI